MAGRTRSTKKLAQRINLTYFKTLGGIPRWRRFLSAGCVAACLVWLGWYALAGSGKPYSAGPVARAHALFGENCGICHGSQAGFRQTATDRACLACHDGPIHNTAQTSTPACSTCHVEHQGAFRSANTSDQACAQCHADLAAHDKNNPAKFASGVGDFGRSHPEFAVLRPGRKDPGTIQFNHQVHLDPDRPVRGPRGSIQLKCADCHRSSGRETMAPVSYAEHCSACHPLEFDRRFSESVPHKEPKAVYDFVADKLTAYIAAHPSEIPPARNAQEWVREPLAAAQLLLWRKTCRQCHALSYPNGPDALPEVAKAAITQRWLPDANFHHRAHQMVECGSCHGKVASSRQTSDVLIPGIQTCRQCHHSGPAAAENRCFECHTYHDWSKEQPVNGAFTIRQLAE